MNTWAKIRWYGMQRRSRGRVSQDEASEAVDLFRTMEGRSYSGGVDESVCVVGRIQAARTAGRRDMRRHLLLWLCALGLVALSGCGQIVESYQPATPAAPTAAPPSAGQSGSVTMLPKYAALGQGGTVQFHATVSGAGTVQWMVNGVPGGSAATGTVDSTGLYTAPASVMQSTNVKVSAGLSGSASQNFASSVVSLIQPGLVSYTNNPQVATYGMYLPAPGKVKIEFGVTTSYGYSTWTQTTPSANGGGVAIYVAGMLAKTPYHMRADVILDDGATYSDTDQVFQTGTPPQTAIVLVTPQAGKTPQPGIELFDTLVPHEDAQAFATDLQGNVIWTYSYGGPIADAIQPIKMLANGHFLVQISYGSSLQLSDPNLPIGKLDELREVDLAGNTIRSLTQAQVAAALQSEGYTFDLGSLHHDVLELPNGHLVLLLSVKKVFHDLTGLPGSTTVLGDALVDVDQNFKPDWVWNSFDHLDVNRHPYLFPDWTHSNSLLYSTDDHNLLLSVRHQDWILKIDFQDGTGTGNILWKLGEGGDFALQGGTDPTDWFYAQHGLSYFSTNTTGVFTLGVMDNGDDRIFPPGTVCGATGPLPCLYSTISVLQVDENRKIATLVVHDVSDHRVYSSFAGDVSPLLNGDIEVDFGGIKSGAVIQELDGSSGTPQLVWQAETPQTYQFRTERLPSLYPGVQW